MKKSVIRTKEELLNELDSQLHLLKDAADSFDNGDTLQVKNLALRMRVLFNDSRRWPSLLSQLGMKDKLFVDTASRYNSNEVLTHCGLITIKLGSTASFVAMLDDNRKIGNKSNFDTWWNSPIFVDDKKRPISRCDLILSIADQDGGAHVDAALNETYHDLSKKEGIGWKTDGDKPVMGAELAAIRQIAHEVLKSLVPNYSKMPNP